MIYRSIRSKFLNYEKTGILLRTIQRVKLSFSPLSHSRNEIKEKGGNILNLECLSDRKLLKICGCDSSEFLQGLMTNDIQHLKSKTALFSLFLNTKGRVMYDSIIYKTNEENTFLVEVDATVLNMLEKHMKMYRVRRAVDITTADNLAVWVMYSRQYINAMVCTDSDSTKQGNQFKHDIQVKEIYSSTCVEDRCNDINVYCDPRLKALGMRVISSNSVDVEKTLKDNNVPVIRTNVYKNYRYKMGICEGASEIPLGQCFPFDINADYLNGVSFNKGCYIGQELTARTYHTGVVRKRLMPVTFDPLHSDNIVVGMQVQTPTGGSNIRLGKLMAKHESDGIALMKVREALALEVLQVGDCTIRTMRPHWWPTETPKDSK